MKLNVLAELDRFQYQYNHTGHNEVKGKCPFHDDENPSCAINIEKGVFRCHAAECNKSGDVITLLAAIGNTDRNTIVFDLGQRYGIVEDAGKVVDAAVIERYHAAINTQPHLLKQLYDRGLSDTDIKQYRIGVEKDRITIPIKSSSGTFVNIRKYLPGAQGKAKFRNLPGHGEIRLYPIEQLKYNKIVVCGGELKAIVAAKQLNQYGIGAVSATGGEGNWNPQFNKHFEDKTVWVCLDIDKGGVNASHLICGMLARCVEWVGNVHLPLDVRRYPHGDINDFVGRENGQLKPLLDECKEWKPQDVAEREVYDDEATLINVSRIADIGSANKHVSFKATVRGKATETYLIPKRVQIACPRGQEICALCIVDTMEPEQIYEINSLNTLLNCVASPEKIIQTHISSCIGIPSRCALWAVKQVEAQTVDIAYVSGVVEYDDVADNETANNDGATSDALNNLVRVYTVNSKPLPGQSYEFDACTLSHPKDSTLAVVSNKYKPLNNTIDTFKGQNLDDLVFHRPNEWTAEGIEKRLAERYLDFEGNVSNVYMRRDLHLLVDLAYHSVLHYIDNRQRCNGWIQVLCVGDSGQAKTKLMLRLQRHYRLGGKTSAELASVAGLLGGIGREGNSNIIIWGALPINDRGLVCIDELSSMSVEGLSMLTSARDGIVDLTKIKQSQAYARTRLVLMSNPRDGKSVDTFMYGVLSLRDVFNSEPDLRRVDAAMVIKRDTEFDIERMRYEDNLQLVRHTHTSALCNKLVLYAWSREDYQITYASGVHEYAGEVANRLLEKYVCNDILLVDTTVRNKIMKLSIALAAMTFSTDDKHHAELHVRLCHVEYIYNFLQKLYSHPDCKLDSWAQSNKAANTLAHLPRLRDAIVKLPNPKFFAEQILNAEQIEMNMLSLWSTVPGSDREQQYRAGADMVRDLTKCNAIHLKNGKYFKTGQFIAFLLKLKAELPDYEKPIEAKKDDY